MEAFRCCSVSYSEALVIVGILRVQGIGIIPDDIEQIRCLVGCEEQFFAENILQQPHGLLEFLIFLFRHGIAVDGVAFQHILLDELSCPDSELGGSEGIDALSYGDNCIHVIVQYSVLRKASGATLCGSQKFFDNRGAD